MMGIDQNWAEINGSEDAEFLKLLQPGAVSKLKSASPLVKIKTNLLINMYWGVLVCCFFMFVVLFYHVWQVQLAFGVVLVFILWALYTALAEYKRLDTCISPKNSLLDELKKHYQSITSWMRVQQRVGLFIYPFSAAGGFMLGGYAGSGKPVAVLLGKPVVLVAMFVTVAALIPACYYLTKWMFKVSFGKSMAQLEQNILELEGW